MSQKARTNYIMRQVEDISFQPDILHIEGNFQYSQDVFTLKNTGTNRFYVWHEILEIKAYKVDLLTTDDVRLDISFIDVVLTISEDIPGWSVFIGRLMNELPSIDVYWEQEVIEIPFAANTRMIYKR